MDADAVARDDIIEDCSESEGETKQVGAASADSRMTPSTTAAPTGVAGRFASYLEARPATSKPNMEVDTGSEALQTFESELDDWLGAPAQAEVGPHVEERVAEEEQDPADDHLFKSNDDGTFTGGVATDGNLDDFKASLIDEPLASEGLPKENGAEESDGSDAEADGLGMAGVLPDAADDLELEEDWKDRPAAERELWERVRPRALRREAARIRDLKLPLAAVNRLMKVHPDLQTKNSEALEIINYATILLLQAMAQATVRGRKATGHTVRLEDVKQVCLSNRELHFLLPLSATLDASALAISRHEDDAHEATTGKVVQRVVSAAPGQSTLCSATFAKTAGTGPAQPQQDIDNEDLDVVTLQGNLELKEKTPQEKASNKRKLPPAGKKAPANKAPRQKAPEKEKAAPGPGITSFFKRAEAN